MKILVLTHRVPFPQNGGYPIVVCNTIRALVDFGHEVSLVSLHTKKLPHGEEHADELLSRIQYRSYAIDTSISLFDGFLATFSKDAYNIDRYYDPNFERLLIAELRLNSYDIIQFEGIYVAPYVDAVRRNSKARLVYRAHNIEHQVWERLARQKGDPFKKFYLRLSSQRIRKYELQQINKFDGIAVFTEQDQRTIFAHTSGKPVEIIPVGVILDHYQPDLNQTEFPSLFFLGSLEWMPNREGIKWFMENFHKEIAHDDLRVKLYVAGSDIPEEFDDYDVMGKIFIQGEVDDALEFVNSKSIMIVPLLSGGGMRVKIIEGMAMQKCIISTALGAEGIQYKNGVNMLIANTREEFLRAMRRCIADEDYCLAVGTNARRLVEEQHEVHHVTRSLIRLYERISAAAPGNVGEQRNS